MIPRADRARLLQLARTALVARVRSERRPALLDDLLVASFGAFVTLYCRNELRGCLGTLGNATPLAYAIAWLAADVAREDHRFDPLRPDELDDVHLEISVLTAPQIVLVAEDIIVGRDGIIIEQGARNGLLLPQVAMEYGWDRETFLVHTCLKAGLSPDAWRNGATIRRFEAEVFSERDVDCPGET
jgi:AmmeMemoRadiSam system protein A